MYQIDFNTYFSYEKISGYLESDVHNNAQNIVWRKEKQMEYVTSIKDTIEDKTLKYVSGVLHDYLPDEKEILKQNEEFMVDFLKKISFPSFANGSKKQCLCIIAVSHIFSRKTLLVKENKNIIGYILQIGEIIMDNKRQLLNIYDEDSTADMYKLSMKTNRMEPGLYLAEVDADRKSFKCVNVRCCCNVYARYPEQEEQERWEKAVDWAERSAKDYYFSVFRAGAREIAELKNDNEFIYKKFRVKIVFGKLDALIVQSCDLESVVYATKYIHEHFNMQYYNNWVFENHGNKVYTVDENLINKINENKLERALVWARPYVNYPCYCVLVLSVNEKNRLKAKHYFLADQIGRECKVKIVVGEGVLVQSYKAARITEAIEYIRNLFSCDFIHSKIFL